MGDYDSTQTLRLPSEEKEAIQQAADQIGLSASELLRTLWRMYAAENRGLFNDEFLAWLDVQEARITEDLENRMAYFEANVDSQIADCFESAMPPEMVAKKMERRLDEIEAGHAAGIIGDDLRNQYKRLVVQRTREYEEDFDAAEQHQHANQRPTGRYSGVKNAGDFEFWIDTCATHLLDGKREWAMQLRDEDAMEFAPAHKTPSDVWDDICDEAVEKAIQNAGDQLLDGRPVEFTDLPRAVEFDPLDRGLDDLTESARATVYDDLLERIRQAHDDDGNEGVDAVLEETNAVPADYGIDRIRYQAGIPPLTGAEDTTVSAEAADAPPERSEPTRDELLAALDIALAHGQEGAYKHAEQNGAHLGEPDVLVAEARCRAYRATVDELDRLSDLSIPKIARRVGYNTTEAEFGNFTRRELLYEAATSEERKFPAGKTADDAVDDALGVQTRATDQIAASAAVATSDGGTPTNTESDNEQ